MNKQQLERAAGQLVEAQRRLALAAQGEREIGNLVTAVGLLADIVETMVKAEETRQAQAQEAEDFRAEHGWHLGRH